MWWPDQTGLGGDDQITQGGKHLNITGLICFLIRFHECFNSCFNTKLKSRLRWGIFSEAAKGVFNSILPWHLSVIHRPGAAVFTCTWFLVSGLIQNREKTYLCNFASMGNSPAVDECLLTFRQPFKTFIWKILREDVNVFLTTNEYKPDRRIGQTNVLNRWNFTTGLSKRLKLKAGTNSAKREFWDFLILKSIFFSSYLWPLTTCPICSLFSTTLIGWRSIFQGYVSV